MDWHAFVRDRLGEITGDAARDAEIVEELAQHMASRMDELRGAGATEQEATAALMAELQGRHRAGTCDSPCRAAASHRPVSRRRSAASGS